MTPWADPPGRITSHTAWRATIVVIGVALIFVIAGIAWLFLANRSAIDGTRELSCRVGAFFVGQPIERQPGQSREGFAKTVQKAESFLRALEAQDCSGVRGATITRPQIRHELRTLRRAVPRTHRGGDHPQASTGSSPPSSPARGGPSPAAPVPPSPPPGNPPTTTPTSPPTTTPAPPPTTTTRPPPSPPPGPVQRITHLVCRVNALGVRVCVSLP